MLIRRDKPETVRAGNDVDVDEADVEVGRRKKAAAGIPGVAVSVKRSVTAMGVRRSAQTLLKLNQVDGFDCQGCAWPDPDPDHRKHAEFCENGAKAVAEEATTDLLEPEFFAAHSIADLKGHSDYWLGKQGRLVHPMVRRHDATHYEPISWDDAFALIGETLKGLDDPDQAIFYTSGKTSNEAAFAYQLFARAFGTNNLPDCSNMCHESTSVALAETIGIGKGSVSLEDVHTADLIVISGQNPGTNHPRMLSALEIAKENGARILSINPLPEAGLLRFQNPQTVRGLTGVGTGLSDLHLPIRINGDLALWQAFGAVLLEHGAIDRDFVDRYTTGFEEYAAHVRAVDWDAVERATGLDRALIREAAEMLMTSSATVHCWAMGITQHRNSVNTIKEFVNVALLRGDIGRPGAGLCPVRGHSNVQGDRTMGIWEKAPDHFLDALRDEYGFEPPREHGLDTVDAIRALRDGDARFFMGMGGNFVSAAPDTLVTEEAMENADLTVMVSTKLNRSHVRCGHAALILPVLGRSERDRTGGVDQRVTVEDSMSAVHASRGPLKPAGPLLRSEVDIVCRSPRRRSAPTARCRGRRTAPTTRTSAVPSRTSCRAARRTTRRCDSRVASCSRTRPATPVSSRPRRARRSSASARPTSCTSPRAGCCCRRCAATTSSTPRSTAWRTATAASPVAGGWCSCTTTTSPPSGSTRVTWSTWSVSGRTASSGRRRRSGSSSTTRRAGARRRTTPRPTRSSRWTRRRAAATARPRSR